MNDEQLRDRYRAAFRSHWRSSIDQGGPTPAFLDDLVAIAAEHAAGHAGNVAARRELREAATTLRDDYGGEAPVIAAAGSGGGGGEQDAPPLAVTQRAAESRPVPARTQSPSARTRTRTRGGAK